MAISTAAKPPWSFVEDEISAPLPLFDSKRAFYASLLHETGSALALSLSDVYMMWQTRFGDAWVMNDDIARDEFWSNAAARLVFAAQLESIPVRAGNRKETAYRIRRPDGDR